MIKSPIQCNLYGEKGTTFSHPLAMGMGYPYVTQDRPDYEPGEPGNPPQQYIANGENGMVAGFKYFQIDGVTQISVKVRGTADGKLVVRTAPDGECLGEIAVEPAVEWKEFCGCVRINAGVHAVFFCYEGMGALDLLEFTLQ